MIGRDGKMEELKDILKLLLGLAAITGFLWLYLRLNLFLYERGWTLRRSPKLRFRRSFTEIQKTTKTKSSRLVNECNRLVTTVNFRVARHGEETTV